MRICEDACVDWEGDVDTAVQNQVKDWRILATLPCVPPGPSPPALAAGVPGGAGGGISLILGAGDGIHGVTVRVQGAQSLHVAFLDKRPMAFAAWPFSLATHTYASMSAVQIRCFWGASIQVLDVNPSGPSRCAYADKGCSVPRNP